MNPKRMNTIHRPRQGEVWCARNIEYTDKIGVKTRPVIVERIIGDVVEYYKCTTTAGIPGSHRILDNISAGLYMDTYVVPKLERIGINRLAYRFGELSRFDRASLSEMGRDL